MAHVWLSVKGVLMSFRQRENLYAVIVFLILVALLIFTVDSSPQWIYQGF
jgi:hypothetical protein